MWLLVSTVKKWNDGKQSILSEFMCWSVGSKEYFIKQWWNSGNRWKSSKRPLKTRNRRAKKKIESQKPKSGKHVYGNCGECKNTPKMVNNWWKRKTLCFILENAAGFHSFNLIHDIIAILALNDFLYPAIILLSS